MYWERKEDRCTILWNHKTRREGANLQHNSQKRHRTTTTKKQTNKKTHTFISMKYKKHHRRETRQHLTNTCILSLIYIAVATAACLRLYSKMSSVEGETEMKQMLFFCFISKIQTERMLRKHC